MDDIKECEHGNTFNCLQCEVKYLKYVIEELQTENERLRNKNNRLIKEYGVEIVLD